MSSEAIIQNIISQLGQAQEERFPSELDIHYADIDAREMEELLLFAKDLSSHVNFYDKGITTVTDDWSEFFNFSKEEIPELVTKFNERMEPHLALFISFLRLYRYAQEEINKNTGRHLDFFYKDVLRLVKRPAEPDKVHVLNVLKKGATADLVAKGTLISAGNDATKKELLYEVSEDTVLNGSKVEQLKSVYVDPSGNGTVRFAPIANSQDGLGGEIKNPEDGWDAFGNAALPIAEVGFAFSSPVLLMKEGKRIITVNLKTSALPASLQSTQVLNNSFKAFLSADKKWIGPLSVKMSYASSQLNATVSLESTDPAITNYDMAIHGYNFQAASPVLMLSLNNSSAEPNYLDWKKVSLKKASIHVDVEDMTSLNLENDLGKLDPKKAFYPFGSHPKKSSRFWIGCEEALSKKLEEVEIKWTWKDAPASMATQYSGYGGVSNNAYFTANASFQDAGEWKVNSNIELFESPNATLSHKVKFSLANPSSASATSSEDTLYQLGLLQTKWAVSSVGKTLLARPYLKTWYNFNLSGLRLLSDSANLRNGFIRMSLNKSFLFEKYTSLYTQKVLEFSKSDDTTVSLPKEPYNPVMLGISLSYKAYTDEVNIDSSALGDFSNTEVQFFHLAPFGQFREHGYLRNVYSFVTDKEVSLLPSFAQGNSEFYVGLSNLNAGDSVQLLFQVIDGSANPEKVRQQISWYVLCDNYWKKLERKDLLADATNELLTSGIVRIAVPLEASVNNSLLPGQLLWLKLTIPGDPDAVCKLMDVQSNALLAVFNDQGNDSTHLVTALAPGSVKKFREARAAVKAITQPYASFGGQVLETDQAFYTRSAERLRHKRRAITPWDYERLVLDEFPRVHKVKCIPHASQNSFLAPGNVSVVLIPDLRNKNTVNQLEPKTDLDTISKVEDFLIAHAAMGIQIRACNPYYQRVRLDFKLSVKEGFEFNYYSNLLNEDIIQFMSPWAFNQETELSFGGKIYKSVLIDFIEEREYVDYITDVKMYTYEKGAENTQDVQEASVARPDAILVSDAVHVIQPV